MLFSIVSVSDRGRVADGSAVRALGWIPGQRLCVEVSGNIVVVRAGPGSAVVSRQGYVRIPAALRRGCGIRAGQRVLLVAVLDQGVLLIHPEAALEAMVRDFHTCQQQDQR